MFWFLKFVFFFLVHGQCTMCLQKGSQGRVSDPPGLKVQTVLSCHGGAGTRIGPLQSSQCSWLLRHLFGFCQFLRQSLPTYLSWALNSQSCIWLWLSSAQPLFFLKYELTDAFEETSTLVSLYYLEKHNHLSWKNGVTKKNMIALFYCIKNSSARLDRSRESALGRKGWDN